MDTERRFELWRERDWRCEWWIVSGLSQARLYLGAHLVNELAAGPEVDLRLQIAAWHNAVHADKHRT